MNEPNTNPTNAPANTNAGTEQGAKLVLSKTPVTAAPTTINVNVGVPGNIRKVVLEANKEWTVNDVLKAAGFDATGYEIRMNGEPVNGRAIVTDGRNILLLRPVTGNR